MGPSVTAIGASAVSGDQVLFSIGMGSTNNPIPGAAQQVTADTIFRIGSGTKTFTALMLLILADRGVVQMDDPISKYLPSFRVQTPFVVNASVTLRQLASKRPGCRGVLGLLCSRYVCPHVGWLLSVLSVVYFVGCFAIGVVFILHCFFDSLLFSYCFI